jgi:hypothetical protein
MAPERDAGSNCLKMRALDRARIRQILEQLEPVDARPDKLLEIFALKDKISGMPDPVYIVLTDEVTREQRRIYDEQEIRRLQQEDPHGFLEIIEIAIRFDKTDELAAVQGVLTAARGENRKYGIFVTRPVLVH